MVSCDDTPADVPVGKIVCQSPSAGKEANKTATVMVVVKVPRSYLTDKELHLLIGPHPNDYPLEHWDGNVSTFSPTGENAVGITAATFEPDPSGQHVAGVTLEFYDDNGLGTFKARRSGGS